MRHTDPNYDTLAERDMDLDRPTGIGLAAAGSRLLLETLHASAGRSPVLQAHDRKMAMLRDDPVRALLLRIEAIGAGRIECDQTAWAQLAKCARLAREAAEKHTGQPFENPLYPERRA